MKEIISAAEAARILLIPAQAVRESLKRNIAPFDQIGCVITKKENRQKQYFVYTRKMLSAFGIPDSVAEERIAKS